MSTESNQEQQIPTVKTTEEINLNSPLTFNNFNADDIDMGETVNVTILIDKSGSMSIYKDMLNEEIRMMIEGMQKWHQAPKIFLSIGTFGEKIEVVTGFQPILNVKCPHFDPNEGETKLYEACREFLKNIIRQQRDATVAGVQCKNILFVLTDGIDNASSYDAAKEVNKMVTHMLSDEQTMGSFGAVMCGIGDVSSFEQAKNLMGFQKLFVIDSNKTAKEIEKEFRAVFGFLSQSVSSVSSSPGATIHW